MLLKRNVIIHLLSLGVLCIGFLLFRYVLFDIHGMKQFPLGLFVIGVISLVISFFFNGKITPICTAFAYIIGFSIGVLFQEDGIDAGGTATNNLWIIWSVVFVFINLFVIMYNIAFVYRFCSPYNNISIYICICLVYESVFFV